VKRYKTNIDDNWSIIHATYGVLSVRIRTKWRMTSPYIFCADSPIAG